MHQRLQNWMMQASFANPLALIVVATALLAGGCGWLDPWDEPPPQPRTVSEWMRQPRVGDEHYGEKD